MTFIPTTRIGPGTVPFRLRLTWAFSLIEIMVAVGLLSVILIGLLAMFYQTQKAFRLGVGQIDVMESGRLFMEMIGREVQETIASGETNIINFQFGQYGNPLEQGLPAAVTESRTNRLYDLYFLRKKNDLWTGTAYRVSPELAGSLYRLEYSENRAGLSDLNSLFTSKLGDKPEVAITDDPPFTRLIDGVVHFQITAYDRQGYPLLSNTPPLFPAPEAVFDNANLAYRFTYHTLPAYVDIEVGILEGPTYATYRARPVELQPVYLQQQAGKVHLFRKRIPLLAAP